MWTRETGKIAPFELLLIEDDPGDAFLVEEAFEDSSFSVRVNHVDNGAKAMSYLQKVGDYKEAAKPDVILLDLNLPTLDGRQVLKELKGDKQLRSIPTVVLSTSQASEDINLAYQLGANCYLQKPYAAERFDDIITVFQQFWFGMVLLPDA